MRNLPPPSWLRTFEAAARLGGFKAASDELGLTPAAVSQQMRALEETLGFPLFVRLPRSVALTELGQSYLPAVRRAFDDLASATAGLFGVAQGRPLTVRAPPSYSALCLAPALRRFHDMYPEVSIRLCSTTWAGTAPADAFDIDIRYGDGRWPVEDIERLSEPRSVLVCPPDTDFGSDAGAALRSGLMRHAIHIIGCEDFWDRFARQEALDETGIGRAISVDSSLAALEIVASGTGVALVAHDLVAPYQRAGRVCIPPGLALDHGQAHYVLMPNGDSPRPEAFLFRNWLMEHVGAQFDQAR